MAENTRIAQHNGPIVLPSQDALGAAYQQGLQEALFSNRLMIAPRRIRDLAHDEALFALEMLRSADNAQARVRERGQRLAEQGLGLNSVLNLCAALRRVLLDEPNRNGLFDSALDAVDKFAHALLEGYMAACQEEVRREQQRTLAAYQRSTTTW
ncbi:MAG: hypothetical protein IT323_04450 [Anaerolineae bacterium]|nr:hypothetical protein [Anaerolineae bacterium]